jgi:glycosyltransferase involved in cell wall biosynthesis
MVIGIDAGAICGTDERLKVGVYRVTVELLKHLSKLDSVNTYRLYSFKLIPKEIMSQFGSNMRNISLTPSTGYMKLRLPIELKMHPVDIFLGVAQAIPKGAKKAIGFIYDLGFLHHPEIYGAQAQVLANQTAALVSRATHIVTISEASKQDIMGTYGLKSENITVVYLGVSEVFQKNKIKASHKNSYFLMVGVNPSKNIPIAMDAFEAFIKKTKKMYDLIIIGGNKSMKPVFQKSVYFLGYISDKELAKWYKGATALVALSQTEGFCLPAVEALVSGCPVIYAKSGSLPEIVGKAGIGVSIEQTQTITDAMMEVIKGKHIIKAQTEKYNWSVFAKKIYDLCNYTYAQ